MEPGEKIERLIGPVIDELGYDLVRVQLLGGRAATLQIMAERRDRQPMKVEDCARISRAISVRMEEADPIAEDYTLEVSSPGIDRPLIKPADFTRFIGHEAKMEVEPPVAGRKRFQGVIGGVDGDRLIIEIDAEAIVLPLTQIRRAKLVLTDRLISAAIEDGAAGATAEIDSTSQIHV